MITLSTFIKLRWQMLIAALTLGAILLHVGLLLLGNQLALYPLHFVIVVGGIPLVLQIFSHLVKAEFSTDFLAAIALIAAVILQEELAAALIILMLAGGQGLESYAMRKASMVLELLVERMPNSVHQIRNGNITEVPLEEIKVGDTVLVYPHETCPVDGHVLEGHGTMDESYLTGEPYQISKAPGSTVISGAMNGESVLMVQTQVLPSDSRYSNIVAVLKEAEQKRPNLRRLGDQIGAIFTPIALIIAFSTWIVTGDPIRFLAVLVIATPCPLLIAIPITIISAISMAARQSIIIKDPTVLEQLPTCRTAIFDKTGTLTYGKPVLTELLLVSKRDENEVLQKIASLERYSKHPLASAIIQEAEARHLPLLNAISVSEKPGQGLSGTIEGHSFHITNRKKLSITYPKLLVELPKPASGLECIVLQDEHYLATLRFHDLPRKASQSFIRHLRPLHHFERIMLVSGDRESEVNYFGQSLQISEVYASQSPEQKLAIVRLETQKAPTLFMGDGINDAPALTAATVGIAFGDYSNITAEAAGAVIMETTFEKVDILIHLSLATRRIALQSAIGGMAFSLIGMGFAAAGLIPPVLGAILQEIIDVIAIVNALRLTLQKEVTTDLTS